MPKIVMFDQAPRIVVFLVTAFVVAALCAASARSRPNPRGWRLIAPSPLHWTALWLSAALSGFMGYIYLFIGSARPDAAHQMEILFWLILAFGLGAVVSAILIRSVMHSAVSWRGTSIIFTGPNGEEKRQLSEITHLSGTALGSFIVQFHGGSKLRLDPNAMGAAELIEKMTDMLGDADTTESTSA